MEGTEGEHDVADKLVIEIRRDGVATQRCSLVIRRLVPGKHVVRIQIRRWKLLPKPWGWSTVLQHTSKRTWAEASRLPCRGVSDRRRHFQGFVQRLVTPLASECSERVWEGESALSNPRLITMVTRRTRRRKCRAGKLCPRESNASRDGSDGSGHLGSRLVD
jgi:hypothetical protein